MTTHPILFQPGRCGITPGALARLQTHGVTPEEMLFRHLRLDPGSACLEDQAANHSALETGARILSFFHLVAGDDDTRIWVITDAEDDDGVRQSTLILLPEEY